jgi:hypothetical protein
MTTAEGLAATQPMQMMVAPMLAPVMTTMPGMNGFPQMPSMTYAAPVPFSWPIEGQWFAFGDQITSEMAPSELPIQTFAPAPTLAQIEQDACESHARVDFSLGENAPTQVQMDMTPFPMVMKEETAAGGSVTGSHTVRRRGHKCLAHEIQAQVEWLHDNMDVEREAEADCDDAQAREIADTFLEQLQAGDTSRQSAIANFEGLIFKNTTTSRAAQLVIKESPATDTVALAHTLHGCVRNAVQSKHANHVVQLITEVLPVGQASFIVDELKGSGHEVARHSFGCRVLCRILEHLTSQDESTLALIDEVLVDVKDLCVHEYGNFVARHLLEFGSPHHKHCIASALGSDIFRYSKHKLGSHVVEAALRLSSLEDQRALALQLASDQQQIFSVAADQYGRHVVRALLGMPSEFRKTAVEVLLPMERRLKSQRYGKSVLASLRAASTL